MTGILYLFATAYILAENNSKSRKILLWVGATILMVLIGLARIAGARHFATDVLAGWSMGYTWFIICVIWYERRKKHSNRIINRLESSIKFIGFDTAFSVQKDKGRTRAIFTL